MTPILPNLLSKPAINPEIAYAAIITGSVPVIIPSTAPIVIPPVAPTSIPFFHPNTSTINILSMFFIEKPKISSASKAVTVIANNKLVPITSSIVKALFVPKSMISVIELANIL